MSDLMVEIGTYKAMEKGFLKGFFNMLIGFPNGIKIQIHDCTHFSKDGRDWFSFPSRQYDKPDGTKGYSSYVRMPIKEQENGLTAVVMQAIKQKQGASHEQSSQPRTNQIQDESPFIW